MCDVAYSPREKVRTIFQGNETVTGLGFEHFHWFEVRARTFNIGVGEKFSSFLKVNAGVTEIED